MYYLKLQNLKLQVIGINLTNIRVLIYPRKLLCKTLKISQKCLLFSAYSGPCQDILLWYLSHTKMCEALSVLRLLSGLEGQKNEVVADLHFRPGSEGGAILCTRESYRSMSFPQRLPSQKHDVQGESFEPFLTVIVTCLFIFFNKAMRMMLFMKSCQRSSGGQSV